MTTNTATTTPTQFPISIELARAIGGDRANEWLNDNDVRSVMAAPAAWRATCYADAVHEYESYENFMELLNAWERGFDMALNAHGTIGEPAPAHRPPAMHKTFSWLHHGVEKDGAAQLIALTMDVCRGVQTCLELIHSNGMKNYNGDAPLLNVEDAERILLLATASAGMLADRAGERIDWLHECATKAAA